MSGNYKILTFEQLDEIESKVKILEDRQADGELTEADKLAMQLWGHCREEHRVLKDEIFIKTVQMNCFEIERDALVNQVVEQEAELKLLHSRIADDAAFITGLESEIVNLEIKLSNMPEVEQASSALCCCGHSENKHRDYSMCTVLGCSCSECKSEGD